MSEGNMIPKGCGLLLKAILKGDFHLLVRDVGDFPESMTSPAKTSLTANICHIRRNSGYLRRSAVVKNITNTRATNDSANEKYIRGECL